MGKGKKASPLLKKALRRYGFEGLIKMYPHEWNLAHQIEIDPTMDPVERVRQIVETFLTMVEERLEEEEEETHTPEVSL